MSNYQDWYDSEVEKYNPNTAVAGNLDRIGSLCGIERSSSNQLLEDDNSFRKRILEETSIILDK
jgi:hypothetical protein